MTTPNSSLNQRIAEQALAAVAWVRSVSLFVKLVLVAGGAFVSGVAKFAPLPTSPVDMKDITGISGAVAAFAGAGALLFLDRSLADSVKLAADAAAELQRVQATAASLGARFAEVAARDRQSRALYAAAGALRGT